MAENKQLFILRHANSAWDSASDFQRPLNDRGRLNVKIMGQWMHASGLVPNYILSSPAIRAKQTAISIAQILGINEQSIHFIDPLYLASLQTLLTHINTIPDSVTSAMVVAHNPGLEQLLLYISDVKPPSSSNGQLLNTATLAHLSLANGWNSIQKNSGKLIALKRPEELSH